MFEKKYVYIIRKSFFYYWRGNKRAGRNLVTETDKIIIHVRDEFSPNAPKVESMRDRQVNRSNSGTSGKRKKKTILCMSGKQKNKKIYGISDIFRGKSRKLIYRPR